MATLEAITPHQGRAARRAHHPRPVQRVVRPQAGGPPRAQLGVPARGVEAGLDSAIVHAARIMPLNKIPDEQRDGRPRPDLRPPPARAPTASRPTTRCRSCWRVFADVKRRRGGQGGPVGLAGRAAARRSASSTATARASRPTSTRRWPTASPPLDIINDVLLAGMKVVGELFGIGRDAAAVRAAVGRDDEGVGRLPRAAHGEGRRRAARAASCWPPSRATSTTSARTWSTSSSPTTATRCTTSASRSSIAEMIEKAAEIKADAIGMSGLLVKSTLIMRDNLEELNGRGLADDIPVLLGGAALTRTYVERDLREVYEGRLFYGKDAFEGLRVMDRLGELKRGDGEADDPAWGRVPSESKVASRLTDQPRAAERRRRAEVAPARSPEVETDNPVFVPPVRRLEGGQGHPPRRHRRLPQRDGAVPQPVAVPAREVAADGIGRDRRRVQGPHPPDAARRSWPRPRPATCSCPRSSTATSPPTATATTS